MNNLGDIMRVLLVLLVALNLTACAPGSGRWFAEYMDSWDTCQTLSRPKGTPAPEYCGAALGKTVYVNQGLSRNSYVVTVK